MARPNELLLTGSGGNWATVCPEIAARGEMRLEPGEAGLGGEGLGGDHEQAKIWPGVTESGSQTA